MHCYTSGPDLLARAAALGAWFSVSGIATFKNAEDVRERVRDMPADRIIVETDCPYLAPVPHRGRRNEPAYVGLVLDKLAEIRGWDRGEAEARTEDAFFALFDRIPRAMSGTLEVTILGCGSSGGVPRADGNWGVCDPADPRNRRTRCSLMVRRPSEEGPERWTTVVVDASPEFRLQTAAAGARRLDALLMTHDHADQSHGIDDIRAFAMRQRARIPVPRRSRRPTQTMLRRFGYIFRGEKGYPADRRPGRDPAARRGLDGRGAVRRDSGRHLRPGPRRGAQRRLSVRPGGLFQRRARPRRRGVRGAGGPRRCGSSTRCATRRIRPTPTSSATLGWIERLQPQAGDPDQPAHRPRLSPSCRRACPRASSAAFDGLRMEVAAGR